MEWQEIEGVPNDGSPFLAACMDENDDTKLAVIYTSMSGHFYFEANGEEVITDPDECGYLKPTHWLPLDILPEPPNN